MKKLKNGGMEMERDERMGNGNGWLNGWGMDVE